MRRVASVVAGTVMLATATLAGAAPAGAEQPVPFTDPLQQGLITLCSASGQRVTSGTLDEMPFVAKAVSSSAAPAGYRSGLATLYAYQPIQYVDPGNWSGEQLTGSTYFSNPAHPGAAATPSDEPLISFTGGYPLHWDGLLQLRLLYTAPNAQPYGGGYPAAVLRVSGNRWTVVQGGNTPCNVTKTRSLETIALRKSQYDPHPSITKAGVGPGAKGGAGGGPSTSGASGSSNDSTSASTSGDSQPVFGSGARLGIGLGVLASLALFGGMMLWRRRA
jgi:hypothetical protein